MKEVDYRTHSKYQYYQRFDDFKMVADMLEYMDKQNGSKHSN